SDHSPPHPFARPAPPPRVEGEASGARPPPPPVRVPLAPSNGWLPASLPRPLSTILIAHAPLNSPSHHSPSHQPCPSSSPPPPPSSPSRSPRPRPTCASMAPTRIP